MKGIINAIKNALNAINELLNMPIDQVNRIHLRNLYFRYDVLLNEIQVLNLDSEMINVNDVVVALSVATQHLEKSKIDILEISDAINKAEHAIQAVNLRIESTISFSRGSSNPDIETSITYSDNTRTIKHHKKDDFSIPFLDHDLKVGPRLNLNKPNHPVEKLTKTENDIDRISTLNTNNEIVKTLNSSEGRYFNAGFFSSKSERAIIAKDKPLVRTVNSYQLGVNIGRSWGLGAAEKQFPDDILRQEFKKNPVLQTYLVVRSFTVKLPIPFQPLILAEKGDSELLFFPIEFPGIGRHAIEIDIIYQGNLLQSRRVEVYLVETIDETPPESAWPVQDSYLTFTRTDALDAESLKTIAKRPRQLTIVAEKSLDEHSIGLRFYTIENTKEQSIAFEQSTLSDTNLATILGYVRAQLEDVMNYYAGTIGGNDEQLRKPLAKLANAGYSFYCSLFPGLSNTINERQEILLLKTKMVAGMIIQVAPLSKQLSIPWELLYERPMMSFHQTKTKLCSSFRSHGKNWQDCPHHDDPYVVCPHGFWGFRYIIEQLPCRLERSQLSGSTLPLYIKNHIPLNIYALSNPNLSNWIDHKERLMNLASSQELTLRDCDQLDEIFAAMKEKKVNIFYVYAHGGKDVTNRPCLKLATDNTLITVTDLNAQKISFSQNSPLFLLNTCESADYTPDDFESFIQFFCSRGAAGVIGVQCDVKEILVNSMMTCFLASFLKQETAGEALLAARKSLMFADRPDPRGLAYSLFAAADLKLSTRVIN
ncbi:CHAT domain-containing protein [Methylomonas sp. MK1]|uniref:CHAT domain-containing protein n=1 Tax=Methylomonas sp. MK1 TaxID=1131552 RepID=UPI0003681623|nr:CHAT domain-containing protein [Methylomonas sp. MK1]